MIPDSASAPAKEALCTRMTQCRICGNPALRLVCDLGLQPLANRLLTASALDETEPLYPLSVVRCTECGLVQLRHIVVPAVLFEDYPYVPSISREYMEHFQQFADDYTEKEHLNRDTLVMDIGNNDGSLLSMFANKGITVLGIDPAENLAALSERKNVPVFTAYFSDDAAQKLHASNLAPTLILAFNTFAHIPDLLDFCRGIQTLLHPNGSFIAQFPYLDDLLTHGEFDTIYHEHCSYFSLRPLQELCAKTGLQIFDVERNAIHGGSLRISIGHIGAHPVHPRVAALEDYEEQKGLYGDAIYTAFNEHIQTHIESLHALVCGLKESGKTIVGFGMPAKGTMLLNMCGLTTDVIDYIVDGTPAKQGKYAPGSHIPIFPEEHLLNNPPDYLLVLAWNFLEEIKRKQVAFTKAGGHFIVPMPEIAVI